MTPGFEGTPRYFAWLYSSEPMQAILKSLFEIETEVSAALQPGLEHSVAHVRTTWWGEEAQRLRNAQALHPLTRSLLELRPPGAPAPEISGLVDITTWDLASAPFETRAELTGYCERWARALPQLTAMWAGSGLPTVMAMKFGFELGVSLCELDMLLSLQHSARLGRLRIPLDELNALGIAPDAVARAPWPAALCEWLRSRHQELRRAVRSNCILLDAPADRAAMRGLLVWAAVMQLHSERAERALPTSWTRSRRSGIADAVGAWRAARRALRFS